MSQSQLIHNALQKLHNLEAMHKVVMQECCNTRKLLERLSSPNNKVEKRALSAAVEAELRISLRKKMNRP